MPPTGPQLKALSDALLAAFPDYDSLRRMVRFGLDENLNKITANTNIGTAVFDLVEWAEANGKLPDLLRAARAANPDNPKLREISTQLAPPSSQAAPPRPPLREVAGEPVPLTLIVDRARLGHFPTISEALGAARPGTRIMVRPGLYEEALVIDKPLEILGDGPREKIEIRAADESVILFRAPVGWVANLTLRQSGRAYGVDISQGQLYLEGCDISSAGRSCVAIRAAAMPILRANRIHDGQSAGVFISESGGLLEDNDIFANGSGVQIRTGGNPILINNRINNGREAGVYIYDNGGGFLYNNRIFANAFAGVQVQTGSNPTLRRNLINKNGYQAVWIYERGGGTFEDNDLRDNEQGAWLIAPDCLPNVHRARNQE